MINIVNIKDKKDEKVDIALFLSSLRGGGAEKVMLTLANEFALQGYSVELVVAEAKGEYRDSGNEVYPIIDLKCSRILFTIIPLVRYIRKKRPKVLLSTQVNANCLCILCKILSFTFTPVFLRESNTISMNHGKHGTFFDKIMPSLMRWLYPLATRVIAVSEGVSEDLSEFIKLPKSAIKVIYNPVVDDVLFAKSKDKLDHPWFTEKKLPIVLAAGRLTRQKDFATLIEAVNLAKNRYPFRLVILGDGELRKELQDLIHTLSLNEYVLLAGFETNPYKYMAKADVFVLSSLWEGLPNVLIQALALGTKVVSTDCKSGPKEILESGHYGLLTPTSNADALMENILTCIKAPMTKSQKNDQIKYCKNKFGKKSSSQHYLSLFEAYLNKPHIGKTNSELN